MDISTKQSSGDGGRASPFCSAIASFRSRRYISYPTASICPCCLPLSIEPAPLISRSRNAILKPEPNCVNSLIASSLFAATSVSTLPRLKVKYAKARRFDLPTRPLS